MDLRGQETEDARRRVQLQRDLKRLQTQLRKFQAKQRDAVKANASTAAIESEIKNTSDQCSAIEAELKSLGFDITAKNSGSAKSQSGVASGDSKQQEKPAKTPAPPKTIEVNDAAKPQSSPCGSKPSDDTPALTRTNAIDQTTQGAAKNSSSSRPTVSWKGDAESVLADVVEKLQKLRMGLGKRGENPLVADTLESVKSAAQILETQLTVHRNLKSTGSGGLQAAGPVNLSARQSPRLAALDPEPLPASLGISLRQSYPASGVAGSSLSHPTLFPIFADFALRTRMLHLVGGNCRTLAFLHVMRVYLQSTKTLDVPEWDSRVAERFMGEFRYNVSVLNAARPLCAGMHYVQSAFEQAVLARSAALTGAANEALSGVNGAGDERSMPVAAPRVAVGGNLYAGATQVRPAMLEALESLTQDIISQSDVVVGMGIREVADGDVIMIYGHSSSIKRVLLECAYNRKRFEVIVLDGQPLYEGRGVAKQLQAANLIVHYCPLSHVCVMLPRCTKVFIGASKIMENGDVMSRAGTAMVAICAAAYHKNVLCFAESYKFVNNIFIGSMTQNEDVMEYNRAGGPSIVLGGGFATGERPKGYLYDVTPAKYIAAIVGCNGRLHPSAVSSLVRDLDFLTKTLKPVALGSKTQLAELDELEEQDAATMEYEYTEEPVES